MIVAVPANTVITILLNDTHGFLLAITGRLAFPRSVPDNFAKPGISTCLGRLLPPNRVYYTPCYDPGARHVTAALGP